MAGAGGSARRRGGTCLVAMTDTVPVGGARGLSEAEAAVRFREEDPNELPAARPKGLVRLAVDVLREPMLLLLAASALVYLALGDFEGALALLAAVALVIGLTLFQEQRTERTLHALRDLSSPRALVIRSGTTRRIAAREVVRGDLIEISEGDRVPADARLLSTVNLHVDESLLTGESVPVGKTAAATAHDGGTSQVYSGTLVVSGHATARVTAIGTATRLGQIGAAIATLESPRTPLQREVGRIVRLLAVLGLSACGLVAVAYALRQGHWIDGALAGLTLAISMVPEEFPVILTVFLAFGAWRLSKARVLTRRLPAIETLGSTTVLCVDKTGTLTQNRMAVEVIADRIAVHDGFAERGSPLPPSARSIVEFAMLASRPEPIDPMERAFFDLAARRCPECRHPGWTLVREYPLSSSRLAVSQVWRDTAASLGIVATKGAPEAVGSLCRLSAGETAAIRRQMQTLASRGLRVLGIARAAHPLDSLPESPDGFSFTWLGLVGLADPIRPGVPEAVRECRRAGIRVVMMTGDYPVTAAAIASQVGLGESSGPMTGAEMDALDEGALRRQVQSVDVFARVAPEQKLRLVSALRWHGEVVAMTGDGVNDAPALKAAEVGIAMGGRGTDVAREAASLVLVDDDFGSIVRAVRMGRHIYENIRKAMAYVFAVHIPIAGVSLIPVLFRWPLVLLPLHIVFVEMIVDPICSIAFEREPEEADLMRRPPRSADARLFSREMVLRGLLQGASALAIVIAVLVGARQAGLDVRSVRTVTFTTLIATNLALIFANRSLTGGFLRGWRTRNPVLWGLTGLALALLVLIVVIPPLREIFEFAVLGWLDLAVCAGAALVAIVWLEIVRIPWRRVRA